MFLLGNNFELYQVNDRLDIYEARTKTSLTFGLQSNWRRIWTEESVDEAEVFSEISVREIDWNRTEKIRILGDSFIENIGEQTFHIGTDQDVSPIDWSNKLFR